MHMADALLSPPVGGAMYAVSVAAVAYSVKKIRTAEERDNKAPLMAVSGAMIFAAQMINFTIPGTGSSGHIGGGILLAALLGPFAGLLALAAVLIIQCLCFADGGLLALGCNIFNIAVIPCLIVYPLVFKPILSPSPVKKRIWFASVVSVVVALQLGSFCVVLQTVASEIAELPFAAFAVLMQPIHLVIGVIEGLVTAAILTFVFSARPELLTHTNNVEGVVADIPQKKSLRPVIITFACIAAVTAGIFSLFASAYPDGLEWSVEKAAGPSFLDTSGEDEYTPVAGLIGAALVFLVSIAAALLIRLIKKRKC